MDTEKQQLIAATNAFFRSLSRNEPPLSLLSHFSTTNPVSIQHAPKTCPHPQTSRLTGLNAIRSYFDLLATHWERISMKQYSVTVNPRARSVTTTATITWRWKKSGRTWNEDFTCTLDFDDRLKICHTIIVTESSPSTCVMRAVDVEPSQQTTKTSNARETNPGSPSSTIEVVMT